MVLWPAVTALGGSSGDIQESLKVVIDGWRAAVDRLLSSCDEISTAKQMAMINCPPCMAWAHGVLAFPCKVRWCPWCYARQCINLLKKMGVDDPTVRRAWGNDTRCCYFQATECLSIDISAATLRQELASRSIRIHDFMVANRETIYGAYYCVDPYPDLDLARNPVWYIRTTILLLDVDGSQLVNTPDGLVPSQVSPCELPEAFINIAPYPATLLTASPDQLSLLTEACFRLRLRYRCGLLHDKDE
jgi:hypothetical protein